MNNILFLIGHLFCINVFLSNSAAITKHSFLNNFFYCPWFLKKNQLDWQNMNIVRLSWMMTGWKTIGLFNKWFFNYGVQRNVGLIRCINCKMICYKKKFDNKIISLVEIQFVFIFKIYTVQLKNKSGFIISKISEFEQNLIKRQAN